MFQNMSFRFPSRDHNEPNIGRGWGDMAGMQVSDDVGLNHSTGFLISR